MRRATSAEDRRGLYFMRTVCHNNLIEAHRMPALLRHVDNEDADETNVVAVTASRRWFHKCDMKCLIGYDAARTSRLVVVNMTVAKFIVY